MERCHRCLDLALAVAVVAAPAAAVAEAPTVQAEVHGYAQTVAVVFDESSVDALAPTTGAPLNDDRIMVRRARLGVRLTAGPGMADIELDGNTLDGPTVQLTRAWVGLGTKPPDDGAWPLLEARLGLMPTPFGAELQRSSRIRPFVERSAAARALFPGTHDLAAALRGQWRFVRYQAALVNGEPLGAPDLPGQDPSASKDLVGRLAVATAFGETIDLDIGASLLLGQGFSPGVAATKDQVRWLDANENGAVEVSELVPIAGNSGRPSETFSRQALGLDAAVRFPVPSVGALRLAGELFWSVNLDRGLLPADPVATGRDQRELGWLVSASQDLFGHVTLAVRYDHYDPDADAAEQIAAALVPRERAVSNLAVTALWTTFAPFVVALQYDHADNNAGRAANGSPTRLPDDRLSVWARVGTP